jgi:pentatricopeptide repeat protein
VTGFTEIAPKLVKYAVKVGDRILAVDSSLGGSMWPVSTTAGVISACTSRLPGQSVTMRFERPTVSIAGEPSASTVSSSSSSVPTRSAVLPTTGGATPETLLKRCRDVLRKYNSEEQQNERTKFSGKYAVPALVADKVLDAVASASVSLDAKTLSLVMNAYLSCKQPAGAIRAFEAAVGISADGSSSQATTTIEGKERGSLVPNYGALNVYTASSLMRAHSLLGDIGSVRRVLAALEGKSGLDISGKETGTWPNYGSMVPDTQLYNIALSATAKSGESSSLEDLLAVFNSMEDRSGREGRPVKDRVSHNTVINALAKAGKYEESFTAFYTMKRSGIKPDKYTYTSLVKACVQEGDMQELLFDMQEKGVKPDLVMYNFMIKTLCEGGQWYEAKKLVTQMEAAGIAPDSMTYGFLMNGLLIANKPSACLSLFEAACADSKTIPLTENVHLYTTAISAASALENHEKAFFLINRMNVAGVKPNLKTMTALMGACMSSGKYTLATEVYKQMEKPDSFAMSKGVEAFCLNGNYEEAMKILSNKECVKGLSGKQQMVAYGHLLRTSLAGGNMEVGRATFKAFLGAGFIPSKLTFQLMIQALEMVPPKKRNLPFAKPISDENFGFVLFVLDSIHNRNLPCDSEFYTSVLLAGSRIGGLRRKICSLMTESRAQTEEPESKQSQIILDENTAARLSVIGWEDLLNNYDARKADLGVSLRLPSLTVRMGREEVRQVLSAEQEVTYRGGANRKPKAKTTQNFVSSE